MRSRTRVLLAGAAFVAVAAMAPAAGAVTAAPSGWQVVPSPNPPNGAALAGVTAVSPTNFWAVGVDIAPDRSGRPFILHQTGTGAWHAVDVPALRSVSGRLAAVSAGSANDVWAVGVRAVPGAPLTAHFDGHTWRLVPSGPVGSGAALLGVATLSPTNAWAVGSRQSGPSTATLVEHWNGKAWQVVPSPSPDPVSSLSAVVALSPTDVWAVGKQGDEFVLPLVEHWDGHAWSTVAVPVPVPHAELVGLTSISAVSPHDIWAVGQGHLTEHWNGHAWQAVPAPAGSTDPDATTNLNGVSARSARDVWAVGTVSGTPSPKTVTEHWNGTTWTLVPSPTPGPGGAILNAVAAPAGGPTVAVGYVLANQARTLVLRNAR